jgi:hypothetical protein
MADSTHSSWYADWSDDWYAAAMAVSLARQTCLTPSPWRTQTGKMAGTRRDASSTRGTAEVGGLRNGNDWPPPLELCFKTPSPNPRHAVLCAITLCLGLGLRDGDDGQLVFELRFDTPHVGSCKWRSTGKAIRTPRHPCSDSRSYSLRRWVGILPLQATGTLAEVNLPPDRRLTIHSC